MKDTFLSDVCLGPRERRYLLAGTVDAVVAVYDTARATGIDPATGAARHGRALATRHIPHPQRPTTQFLSTLFVWL